MPGNPKGSYLLVARTTATQVIDIGRLGSLPIEPGFYVYSGSAFGPGGVDARVRRHLRGDKRLHWHIDYLLAVSDATRAWYVTGARRECEHARGLAEAGGKVHLTGFGASDCACASHLLYFDEPETIDRFIAANDLLRFG